MSTKQLTIRDLPTEIDRALREYASQHSESINKAVSELLARALGVPQSGTSARSNGLEELAGTWSEEEFQAFERATEPFREIDEELWQ